MMEKKRTGGVKTLDNGLRVLESITQTSTGMTLTELASITMLHPTVVFRLLQTLETHRLVRRDSQKRYFPGAGLIPLANAVDADLKAMVEPVLQRLAEEAQAASYLMVTASDSEVMAEVVIQPRRSSGFITFSPGSMHAIARGSGGIAILAGRAEASDDEEWVIKARREGVAVSVGHVLPNVIGVAAPLSLPDRFPEASIGVSLLSKENLQEVKRMVREAAREIASRV